MTALDSLPGDQRAVLQLVLGRGRSYDEIARMLSIDAAAVRERAHAAGDALGPVTAVPSERRAQIVDYLLGQLPEGEVADVRGLLAWSPRERAWARVLSSELAPAATGPLPEIPTEGDEPAPSDAQGPAGAPTELAGSSSGAPVAAPMTPTADPAPVTPGADAGKPLTGAPRSSRLGGIILIAVALIVVGVVLFLILRSGSSDKHPTAAAPTTTSANPGASATTTSPAPSTGSGSGTSTSARVVAQINLSAPRPTHSKAVGIAEVLTESNRKAIAIVAQNIPPNSTHPPNAYAVWLYNSSSDAHRLGFVNPGVGKTGRLSTVGPIPSDASRYKRLIVTLETTAAPKQPGAIILEGTLTGL